MRAKRLKPWLITTLVLAGLFSLLSFTLAVLALMALLNEGVKIYQERG
jgi:hypothetical protein